MRLIRKISKWIIKLFTSRTNYVDRSEHCKFHYVCNPDAETSTTGWNSYNDSSYTGGQQ